MNEKGTIAAYSLLPEGRRGWTWSSGSGYDVPGLPQGSFVASEFSDVNDRDHVTGRVITESGRSQSFLYRPDTGYVLIPSSGGSFHAMNEHDVLVGGINAQGGGLDLAIWDEGHGTTRINKPLGSIQARSRGILDDGTIYGTVEFPSVGGVGFTWNQATGYQFHQAAQGVSFTNLLGTDGTGSFVGWASYGGQPRAYLYSDSVGMLFLDERTLELPVGFELTEAWGVNTSGTIVGTGRYMGVERAFMLTKVVPEPCTLLSFVALAAFRKRRAERSS